MYKSLSKLSRPLSKWKFLPSRRPYSDSMSCNPTGISPSQKGLVLGCYVRKGDRTGETLAFTEAAKNFNDAVNGQLLEVLKTAKPPPGRCEVRTLFGLHPQFPYVTVVGLDEGCLGYNEREGINEKKECVRNAAALGTKALLNFDLQKIYLESFDEAESSAEGASMGMWSYDELKTGAKKNLPKLELHDSCDWNDWQIGMQKGTAQNLTRQLQEIPANLLTPKAFARNAVTLLSNQGIDINVRTKRYMESRNLTSILAVSSGSCEEPQLLEATYEGCDLDKPPVVMVAPGLTYNSGGLGSLRSCTLQKHVRGEVSGAAALIAMLRAVSALKLELNLKVYIPLAENVIGAGAMESGAVVRTKNLLTVLVNDTARANQLIVSDVLAMVAGDKCIKPRMVLDLGPYTDSTQVWTTQAAGAFTSNHQLMEALKAAAVHTGDRVWRLPLWDQSSVQMTTASADVDLVNSAPKFGGYSMQAAAFLKQFVPADTPWLHMEIGGLLRTNGLDAAYLSPGMSGKPTRTLIELLGQLTCPQPKR